MWLKTRHYGKKAKNILWIFSGRVFCADSEYMLDVVYGPILAEKKSKKPVFGKIPKK
jgi:hypothetical protein